MCARKGIFYTFLGADRKSRFSDRRSKGYSIYPQQLLAESRRVRRGAGRQPRGGEGNPGQGYGPDAEYDELDNDTIEDHLSALGITGATGELRHDNGDYTHVEDERIMRASAEDKVFLLQSVGRIGRVKPSRGQWRLLSPHPGPVIRCEPPPAERHGRLSVLRDHAP